MTGMTLLALLLAFVWGGIWAAFLQFTPLGRFLAVQRTWITVVIGVGGDLAIALLCVEFEVWARFAGVVVLSAICIVARSLANERNEVDELGRVLRGDENEIGE